MRSTIITSLVFVIYHLNSAFSSPQEAELTCITNADASYTMNFVLTKNNDRISRVFGVEAGGTTITENCDSKEAGISYNDGVYNVTIELSRGADPIDSPDCGVISHDNQTFSFYVIAQEFPDILQATDKKYELSCNFNTTAVFTVNTGLVNVSGSVVDLNDVSTKTQRNDLDVSIDLAIMKGDGITQQQGPINLGENCTLKATLTQTDGYKGVRLIKCKAKPSSRSNVYVELIDADGCVSENNILRDNFKSENAGSVALTGLFEAFKFLGRDTVYFECQAVLCSSENDPMCAGNHCQPDTRRKRRSTPSDSEQAHIATMIEVHSIFDDLQQIEDDKEFEQQPQNANLYDCFKLPKMAITLGLLTVFSFVCFLLVVISCAMLRCYPRENKTV